MATPEQVAALRLLIDEPDETTYTDVALSNKIDARQGNLDLAAYDVWTEKASAAADLVDVSEGGSSRKMGDLHEQAMAMAKFYAERAQSPVVPPDGQGPGVRIKRLVRP